MSKEGNYVVLIKNAWHNLTTYTGSTIKAYYMTITGLMLKLTFFQKVFEKDLYTNVSKSNKVFQMKEMTHIALCKECFKDK